MRIKAVSTPNTHQRRTRIKAVSTPDVHQPWTRIKAERHQGRTRIKAEHASGPNDIKAERASRPHPHQGRTCIKARRASTPHAHQRRTRIKAECASTTHAHQGRTRIKAERARPNVQGRTCKAARASTPDVHQGRTRRTRINTGRASAPNVQGRTRIKAECVSRPNAGHPGPFHPGLPRRRPLFRPFACLPACPSRRCSFAVGSSSVPLSTREVSPLNMPSTLPRCVASQHDTMRPGWEANTDAAWIGHYEHHLDEHRLDRRRTWMHRRRTRNHRRLDNRDMACILG